MNKKISKARMDRARLRKKFLKNRFPENRFAYNQQRNFCASMIRFNNLNLKNVKNNNIVLEFNKTAFLKGAT